VLLRTQPDERLVAMARKGDGPAFDELARRHRPALTAYAGSLAPSSRAEDVVQDSLLKAYLALGQGAEPELLRAWLFRIVRNSAIDEQRGVRPYEQLDENYDGVEQPPQALERRERLGALTLAIQDLPPAQRQAIVQRELEGRGHEEIAQAMKLSPGSVRQLIYRARHTLREAAGAIIPAALVRAACMPGAGEAVGGLGAAGALKLGLAAVVATGTIVAGTSIDRHQSDGTAEALQLPKSERGAQARGSNTVGDDRSRGGASGEGERRGSDSSEGSSGKHSSGGGGSGSSGPGGGGSGSGSGESEHSGSMDGGGGSNSGPGSGSSGDSGSGSGSGSGGDSGSGVSGGGSGTDGSGSGGDGGDLLQPDGGTDGGTLSSH
jgi:RNA polymerase sigma factor (sigma-70 family)